MNKIYGNPKLNSIFGPKARKLKEEGSEKSTVSTYTIKDRQWDHINRIISPIKVKPINHTTNNGDFTRINEIKKELNPNNNKTLFKCIIKPEDSKK